MTPERYEQIEELCHKAMEQPAGERSAFLQAACGGDEALRREVESLLPAYENQSSFLEAPPGDIAADMLKSEQTQSAPRRTLAHYEVRSLLDRGGMGEVYLAEDPRLGRLVAIKLLARHLVRDETAKARFLREARAASRLDHPNIGTVHDIGEQDGELFMVMALYEGETLKKRLERGALPVDEALGILRQVAQGLEAAHRAGIVHRDIKPANILMTSTGTAKILDFGLAKLFSDSQSQTMTQAGQVMGTPLYMSPEQLNGESVDWRSDLWSLGALAYELLSGASPFQTDSSQATVSRILHDEPPSFAVPGLPDWLAALVSELLRKNPGLRPQSASELLKRLDQPPLSQPAPPRPSAQQGLSELKRQGWRWAAVGIATCLVAAALYLRFFRGPAAALDSIAVLPFANAGGDPNTEYLSDGITESVINSLSQLRNLRVIARTTVFRYKGKDLDAQKIGRDLNVRATVTGRIQQRGTQLNIQAELVDVEKGSQLWGGQFNRQLAEVGRIQEDISKEISEKLRLRLTGEDQKRLSKHYTENTEAYQLYLRGRYEWNKRTADGLKKSIEYFNQAIEKDPGYALAYAGLADVYNVAAFPLRLSPKEVFPRAKAAATKAVELDDTLAEAHSALATVKSVYDWDWLGAEREFRRAIELNPGYPTVHYFYGFTYLLPMGRFDEAITELKRAIELDPFSAILNVNLGWALYFVRRYDDAIVQLKKAAEIDPNFGQAHMHLAEAYEEKGMHEEAIAELAKLPPAYSVSLDPRELAMVRQAYAMAGMRGYWQKYLEILKDHAKQRYVPPSFIAGMPARLGDKDQAFEWLEKAYEARDEFIRLVRVDPTFDNLHSDPRYADLLRRMGLPR